MIISCKHKDGNIGHVYSLVNLSHVIVSIERHVILFKRPTISLLEDILRVNILCHMILYIYSLLIFLLFSFFFNPPYF